MRYFMTIVPSSDYEAGKPVPPQLMEAMGPFIEKYIGNGMLISTAGLKNSKAGSRLTTSNNRVVTKDGPFAESKELIGGYAVLEAPGHAEAVAVAQAFVQLHIDNGMPDISVDVREIDGGYNY